MLHFRYFSWNSIKTYLQYFEGVAGRNQWMFVNRTFEPNQMLTLFPLNT